MKRLSLLILSIFVLTVSSSDLRELTEGELKSLVKDSNWLSDNLFIQQNFQQGINLVYQQNEIQSYINQVVIEYLEASDEDFSNEELWGILNPIKESAFEEAEEYQSILDAMPLQTASSLKTSQELYRFNRNLLNQIADYLWRNSRFTITLIEQLESGDLEKYDYQTGRSYILNADFLNILADFNEASVVLQEKGTLRRELLELDSKNVKLYALFNRAHGKYLMGELTPRDMQRYMDDSEDLYDEISNSKDISNIREIIQEFADNFAEISKKSEEIREYEGLMQDYVETSDLYVSAILKSADGLIAGTKFYYRNRYDLNDEITSSSEFDYILAFQTFNQEQMAKSADKYNILSQEITANVLPIIASLWK